MNLGAVLALAALLIVPGVPAALALARPGRLDPITRLAAVPVLGTVAVGGVGFSLTMAGAMSAPAFFAALGLVTVGLGAVVFRRDGGLGALRAHVRGDAAERRADLWPILLGLAAVVAIAVVRWSFESKIHFGAASAWRYWADALEIADAGGVPAASLQYGTGLVPTVSKIFLNAMNAGASYVVGSAPLPALGALLFVASVGLSVALWSLGRELGLRWTAPLLPMLLLVNRTWWGTEITTDLDAYRAEIVGRMLAFGALALFVHGLRHRRPRLELVVAGAVLGASLGVHLVPAVVAAGMAAVYGLAVLLREPGRRRTLARGVVAAGAAVVVAGALLLLPSGDIGLSGAGSDDVYADFPDGFDPTLFINSGLTADDQAAEGPFDWTLSPGDAYRAFVATAFGEPAGEGIRPRQPDAYVDAVGPWILVAGIVLLGAGLWRFPSRLRASAALPLGLIVALVGLTWWFSQRSELFIPANFGLRRLYDYSPLPLFLGVLLVLELVFLVVRRERVWVPAVLAGLVLAFVMEATLPTARVHPALLREGDRVLPSMRWIAENVPCDAFILSNEHTEGLYQAALGRAALLEGMTPYLRPEVARDTIALFLEARAFFADPERAFGPMAERGVTHVVINRGRGDPPVVGGANADGLVGLRYLELLHETEAMRVYEVREEFRRGTPPEASAYPGYRCVTDPGF